MRHLKNGLIVLGAITVLVLAANTVALAATGHALLLGKYNQANRTTVLTRTTNGPALRLVTRNTHAAPLTTNAHGKVRNLNADRVDGLHAAALRSTRAHVYRFYWSSLAATHTYTLPTLADGTYLLTASVPMFGAAGTQANPTWVYCRFQQQVGSDPTTYHGIQQTNASGEIPFLNTSAVIRTSEGNPVSLQCGASTTWDDQASWNAEISVIRLDGGSFGSIQNLTTG